MYQLRIRACWFTLFAVLSVLPVKAEELALSRFSGELEFISSLVLEASEYQRVDDTEVFQYEHVLHNIRLINEAIKRHVTRPSVYPRDNENLYDLSFVADLATGGPTEQEELRLRVAIDELSALRVLLATYSRRPANGSVVFNYSALDDSLVHIQRSLRHYAARREQFNPRSLTELESIYGRSGI